MGRRRVPAVGGQDAPHLRALQLAVLDGHEATWAEEPVRASGDHPHHVEAVRTAVQCGRWVEEPHFRVARDRVVWHVRRIGGDDGDATLELGEGVGEIAVHVADTEQHAGIGTLLVEQLVAAARRRRLHRLTAEVLAENTPMLAVLRELGLHVRTHTSTGVTDVDIDLDEAGGLDDYADAVTARERAAEIESLEPLLAPRTLAVYEQALARLQGLAAEDGIELTRLQQAQARRWVARLHGEGLSPRSLTRHFRDETTLSFAQWRQQARLSEALRQLTEGRSVADIAHALGFSSASAFVTVFRRHFGLPPGRYLARAGHGLETGLDPARGLASPAASG